MLYHGDICSVISILYRASFERVAHLSIMAGPGGPGKTNFRSFQHVIHRNRGPPPITTSLCLQENLLRAIVSSSISHHAAVLEPLLPFHLRHFNAPSQHPIPLLHDPSPHSTLLYSICVSIYSLHPNLRVLHALTRPRTRHAPPPEHCPRSRPKLSPRPCKRSSRPPTRGSSPVRPPPLPPPSASSYSSPSRLSSRWHAPCVNPDYYSRYGVVEAP
jgi:hypothetical protein